MELRCNHKPWWPEAKGAGSSAGFTESWQQIFAELWSPGRCNSRWRLPGAASHSASLFIQIHPTSWQEIVQKIYLKNIIIFFNCSLPASANRSIRPRGLSQVCVLGSCFSAFYRFKKNPCFLWEWIPFYSHRQTNLYSRSVR